MTEGRSPGTGCPTSLTDAVPGRPGPWQACSSPLGRPWWSSSARWSHIRLRRTSSSCSRRTGHQLVRRPARSRPAACHPGSALPAAVLSAALVAACLLTGRLNGALLAATAVPVSVGLVEVLLKPFVHRTYQGVLAYPSGHTTAVFALAATVTILLLRPASPPKARGAHALVSFTACLVGSLVAAAVIGLRWHYLTDTIGGAAVGIASVCGLALALDFSLGRRRCARATRDGSPGRPPAPRRRGRRPGGRRPRRQGSLSAGQARLGDSAADTRRSAEVGGRSAARTA